MQIGGAFGVNLLAILLQRRLIFHGDHLASSLTEANPELAYSHTLIARELETNGMPALQAFQSAFGALAREISIEASVYAFRDCFFVISVWFAIVFCLLIFMPKPQLQPSPAR